MSDRKLRELERRFRETGSAEAEAAYLLERVRVGDLGRPQLELAAHCGHDAALQVVGGTPEAVLCDWCFTLVRWGREAALRAVVASGRWLLRGWRWPHPGSDPSRALAAAERWLLCPCSDHGERARDAAEEVLRLVNEVEGDRDLGVLLHHTVNSRAATSFARAAFIAGGSDFEDEGKRDAVRAITDVDDVLGDPDSLRSAIGAEVARWALGYGDPVRDRTEGHPQLGAAGRGRPA